MSLDVLIEPLANDADLDGVMAVDRESFAVPWTREMYAGELDAPGAVILVARTPEARVAGYCSYRVVLDEVHINNVAVQRGCRRLGLGRRLVDRVIAEALAGGCRQVILEVRSANEAARKLYENLGFSQIGRRRGYYADPPDDALVLGRDLRKFESDP